MQAVADYHLGRFKNAFEGVDERMKNRKGGATALHWFLLAMIYHQLGEPVDARNYLEQGVQYLKDYAPFTRHETWHYNVFRAEAESLLGPP